MATKQIEFSPAIPIPLVFDVQGRIQELRGYLDPKHPLYQPEQNVNIEAVIKLYKEKKINGIQEVWIMEGKVVTEEEADNRAGWVWVWCEVCFLTPPPRGRGRGGVGGGGVGGVDSNYRECVISMLKSILTVMGHLDLTFTK